MKHQIIIRPDAEADLQIAFHWYEDEAEGLGSEFLRCIDAAISSIDRSPEAYSFLYKNIRRILVRRFPYGIFYLTEKDRIIVLAVLHFRRDPNRWPH